MPQARICQFELLPTAHVHLSLRRSTGTLAHCTSRLLHGYCYTVTTPLLVIHYYCHRAAVERSRKQRSRLRMAVRPSQMIVNSTNGLPAAVSVHGNRHHVIVKA